MKEFRVQIPLRTPKFLFKINNNMTTKQKIKKSALIFDFEKFKKIDSRIAEILAA